MSHFETIVLDNVRVHICPTNKFKTTTFVALIQQELTEEFVTKTALVPQILQRGTETYPETLELKRRLDELYGATLFGDVIKKGERHILHFGMELANEQYLKEKDSLLRSALILFMEVLFNPAKEGNGFKDSYLQAEKKNLKQRIESLQDDKARYASQRMIETMYAEEPYSLSQHGKIEDISGINAADLYTYYQEILSSCPIDFYCVGNVSSDDVVNILSEIVPSVPVLKNDRKILPVKATTSSAGDVNVVVEEIEVKQGKLNMGCYTTISLRDEDYPALLVYNGVLGGFPHSKLFVNVREKESLAYYASSKLESHKGLLIIQSGIEIKNYDKAVRIIKEQLASLEQGSITDEEIGQTKAMISNQLREQQDRAIEMIHFHYQGIVGDLKEWDVSQLLERIEKVDRKAVQDVAHKIKLDTIYFLRDKAGAQDGQN